MKPLWKIICGACLVVSSTAGAGAQVVRASDLENLVRNPSFEMLVNGHPEGWSFHYRPKSADPKLLEELKNRIQSSVSKLANSGSHAASINANNHQNEFGFAYWEQSVPVKPNTRYYFSVMSRVEGRTWCSVALVPYTGDRKQVQLAAPPNGSPNVPPEAAFEYTKVQQQIVTGNDTERLSIELRVNAGTVHAHFDDLKLVEIPTADE